MSGGTAVTVLVPVHDGERFVGEAIRSVLAQTQRDLELLVVDDGSRDGSAGIVEAFAAQDSRVRLHRLEHNRGVGFALRYGLERATGGLVARLDADDVAKPERLARQLAYLRAHPEVVLLGTAYEVIDAAGAICGTARVVTDPLELRWWLLFGNVYCQSTVVFRREAALAAGGYREDMTIGEDFDLFVRLARLGEIAQIPDVLGQRRLHDRNLSLNAPPSLRELYVRTVAASIEGTTGRGVSLDAARWLAAETSWVPASREALPEAVEVIPFAVERMAQERPGAAPWLVPLALAQLARLARRDARGGLRRLAYLGTALGWSLRFAPASSLRWRWWRRGLAPLLLALVHADAT